MTAWYSHFSGKEKFFINNKLIISNRNYGYFSRQHFQYNGHYYSIRLEPPLSTGSELYCTLSKNGQDVQKKKVKIKQDGALLSGYGHSLLQFTAVSALILTLCLFVGVLSAYFQWSAWVSYALILAIFGFGLCQLCINVYRQQQLGINVEDAPLT